MIFEAVHLEKEKGLENRNRIIDPEIIADHIPLDLLVSKPGIELLQMMIEGKLPPPPIAKTLNFKLTKAKKGEVEFRGIPLFEHYNPAGTVHGGWAATLLDSALGCVVHTMMEPGQGYTTIEFKVNLVRPMFENTGEVICTSRLRHIGRSIATSEAEIVSSEGKLIAHGVETCAIFPIGNDKEKK